MVQAKKNTASSQSGTTKYFTPSKPNFVKLRAGESYEGIFMGMGHSQFGPCYKFRDDKGEIFTVGGNRAQIDQLFSELMGNPEGFVGDTIIGHLLVVERLQDTKSKNDRRVAQYRIGHIVDRCPKGCKG